MRPSCFETWELTKRGVEASGGLVASQHHLASEIGARVLAEGGNAVDAAIAASFAIGTLEPWMSGLGGGGYLLLSSAATGETQVVSFGMVAPRDLDPGAYPLVAGTDHDLFSWPAVEEDRNVKGPLAIAVPGYVAGLAKALEAFGTRSWSETLAPAIELAERGIEVDWYATLKIAGGAADLAQYPESRRTYLPNGFPPVAEWAGPLPRIVLGELARTLRRLAAGGAEEFYRGEIARALVEDVRAMGGFLSREDLARYEAKVEPAGHATYRGHDVFVAPELTGGPSLIDALSELAEAELPPGSPDARSYESYVRCLEGAYARRLSTMGEIDDARAPGCTTHLSVVDREGNLVALTQTLLSVFGSKVMLPKTGVLMNNGIMWFDPRPGRPNSIAPGKRPLSNMCPTIVSRADGARFALGASGGRRIMPAVFQLVSFLTDFGMSLDRAFATPRIDYSGDGVVTVDHRLVPDRQPTCAAELETRVVYNSVYPAHFACPNAVGRYRDRGLSEGAAFITSPWAKVAGETPLS